MTRRLIESWLPIAPLGEESVRERRSMTALLPTYYLHVWWARRPLVASRAAVLASLLSADADRDKVLCRVGIHGDAVAAKRSRTPRIRWSCGRRGVGGFRGRWMWKAHCHWRRGLRACSVSADLVARGVPLDNMLCVLHEASRGFRLARARR